jgi:ribosomal protein S20
MQAKILVYMKDGKKYKLAGFNTFDEFCKHAGISRRSAYRMLKHVKDFGLDAYKAIVNINMREKDLKLLKQSGATITEEEGQQVINVSGVSVPIGPESKDELSEIISDIVKKKEKAERELKQAQRVIEKKEAEVVFAKEQVAEVLKPFSGDREEFQSSLEQLQRDFDVICTKMHMHWNKADNDRIKESMVTSTTHWLNERVVELIDAFIRMEE